MAKWESCKRTTGPEFESQKRLNRMATNLEYSLMD